MFGKGRTRGLNFICSDKFIYREGERGYDSIDLWIVGGTDVHITRHSLLCASTLYPFKKFRLKSLILLLSRHLTFPIKSLWKALCVILTSASSASSDNNWAPISGSPWLWTLKWAHLGEVESTFESRSSKGQSYDDLPISNLVEWKSFLNSQAV